MEVLHYTEEDKRSLYESLLRGYERSGDKSVALAFYGNHVTWKQFMHEVDCAAAALLSRGVKKGDSITVFTPNIPQGVIAIYAINRIGNSENLLPLCVSCFKIQNAGREASGLMWEGVFEIRPHQDDTRCAISKSTSGYYGCGARC